MTALAITPASGSITHAKTICRVDVSGAPANTLTGYDPAKYPSSPAVRYYIAFIVNAVEEGRSYVFGVNGGKHSFNNYIFPSAGTWTLNLCDVKDDSTAATLSVVVA